MAFNSFETDRKPQPLAEINMIPLIDVMLVLLILFIVTAPFFTPHAFKIALPQAATQPSQDEPQAIHLAIDAGGRLYWSDRLRKDEAIEPGELRRRLGQAAQQTPVPEVQLRADKNTPYQRLADILGIAQQAGIQRLGFITEPLPAP